MRESVIKGIRVSGSILILVQLCAGFIREPDPAQAALLDRLGIVLPKRIRLAPIAYCWLLPIVLPP